MMHLTEELESIILNVGDIIIDTRTNFVGILLQEEFRDDDVFGGMTFWHVKWSRKQDDEMSIIFNKVLGSVLEEDGIKLSIMMGILVLHTVDGEQYEP